MVFKVPASKASIKQNQFEFELDVDGKKKKFSLPKMQYISSDLRERMQSVGASIKSAVDAGGTPDPEVAAEMGKIQRELFEKYVPDLYRFVSDDQLEAIQEAWQEASGITVGESSPSAD